MHRSSNNPILTRASLPDIPPHLIDATSVFNPGAASHDGEVRLMLRVQSRARETFLVMADSKDGFRFKVRSELVHLEGIEQITERLHHIYDPRITCIEGMYFIVFAADTDAGCRLGIARTADFTHFKLVSLESNVDTRNGVLFPERFDGHYLRLERPNRLALEGGPTSGDEMFLSKSKDLKTWLPVASVFKGRPRYWDERIGSGPPPIKTREGWLHIYHGVATHFNSVSIYQAGCVLLDLKEPARLKARTHCNILEPREAYELIGQVPNVVFPSGLVVDDVDSEGFARPSSHYRLYYGAADTCVGLATGTVQELLDACNNRPS